MLRNWQKQPDRSSPKTQFSSLKRDRSSFEPDRCTAKLKILGSEVDRYKPETQMV
jgi:hypothetical protein